MSWILILGIGCVLYTTYELLRMGANPTSVSSDPAPIQTTGPIQEGPTAPAAKAPRTEFGVVDTETGEHVEVTVDRRTRNDPEKAKLGRRATDPPG